MNIKFTLKGKTIVALVKKPKIKHYKTKIKLLKISILIHVS